VTNSNNTSFHQMKQSKLFPGGSLQKQSHKFQYTTTLIRTQILINYSHACCCKVVKKFKPVQALRHLQMFIPTEDNWVTIYMYILLLLYQALSNSATSYNTIIHHYIKYSNIHDTSKWIIRKISQIIPHQSLNGCFYFSLSMRYNNSIQWNITALQISVYNARKSNHISSMRLKLRITL
jgi:hypothetical protein